MARRPTQVGDCFVRQNGSNSVWVVERIFEYPDMPHHARLHEVGTSRVVTFALNVLESETQFRFVQNPDQPK
jgi:hypothetical protein